MFHMFAHAQFNLNTRVFTVMTGESCEETFAGVVQSPAQEHGRV